MLKLARLYLPLLLLSLPWAVAPLLSLLEPAMRQLVGTLPLPLFGLALAFAAGFKRGRLALCAIHLGFAALLLQQIARAGLDQPDAYVLYTLLGLTVCVVQVWILVQRDTSLFCRRGLSKLALTLAPYVTLACFWSQPGELAPLLVRLHPLLLEQVQPQLLLSRGVAWLGLPILGLSLLLTLTRRTPDEIALFGALLCVLLAMALLSQPPLPALLLSVAPLLLTLSVIQHIYAMAFVDTLTGVPARRALEHRLAGLGRQYAIAMLDIDHFKQFNDTYGHDVGDQVLRMVATQLRQVGAGGSLFRYGGEEFTIVFNGRREEEVVAALDAVRQRVEHYPMQVRAPQRPRNDKAGRQARQGARGQKQVQVTISIGVAWRESDERPDMVIKRADKALYRAKGAGRNRVMTDGPDPRRQRRAA